MTYTTAALAVTILKRLENFNVRCLLAGGWAEEALQVIPARAHRDVDLLFPAQSFSELDRLFGDTLTEVPLKRFAHKRAFLFEGAMVEVVLVQRSGDRMVTLFWGDVPFEWKLPLEETCSLDGHRISAVSRDNLRLYRECHASTQPWRWKDPTSVRLRHFPTDC
jgi:hypothetical protein